MKTYTVSSLFVHLTKMVLGFGLMAVLGSNTLLAATPNDSGSFVDKMKKWEDKMSDKFRDAWQGWHEKKEQHSIGAASIDLREQRDSYMLRLSLPERDINTVEVTLSGGSLHIVAPSDKKESRYEQVITLPGVKKDAAIVIDRRQKDHLVVITVPKESDVALNRPSLTLPDPSLAPLNDWDRDILARMEKTRREMDRIFDESFDEFRLMPEHKGTFDQPRFGSSLDLQDEGNNYVVRAYLPERDMRNIEVNVEGQTLKIEAKAEENAKKDDPQANIRKAHYVQMINLPGPVKAEKMEVKKKEDMLIVTLPKA